MDLEQLEQNIKHLTSSAVKESFIFDLLLMYGHPKASITRLRKGDYNLSNEVDSVLWKKKLYFKIERTEDLHGLIDQVQKDPNISRHHPRFIIVTDFKTLLALDTKTSDSLDIEFQELHRNAEFFLPWAGMEKAQIENESLADRKAAEKLARLYDIIIQDNEIQDEVSRHALNVFLSRLLFCFFAEDTGIFTHDQFTNAVASHTADDGSDLQAYLQRLFEALNKKDRSDFPTFLQAFPYVNGGLFAQQSTVPKFTAKARNIIIECGSLNWKAINPDIFGSMIQAVVHSDQRGSLGMHYTSVVNIMKVIEPLFLNDLYEELEKAGNHPKKLKKLLGRLFHLRIFDPACGSGNFLIIAYKELCKLEIKILQRLDNGQMTQRCSSHIRLSQFYGIDIDDFACQTASLSLWLADHQMNLTFKEVFGDAKPTLPLQEGGQIVCDNATRLDWEGVCPKEDRAEIYILGNPPYLGSSMQSKEQKVEMAAVFDGIKGYKNLDYIACWFFVGATYIQNNNAQLAFVSTNSISQGEQVAMIWPHIFSINLEIGFAHQSFKWTNNAKGNAGVTCIVVGIRNLSKKPKILFKNGISRLAKNINPYITNGLNLVVSKRSSPLSTIPKMTYGNKAVDGGNLILTEDEKDQLITDYPDSESIIRPFIGSSEFIRGSRRFCLWIADKNLVLAQSIPPISQRICAVKEMRLNSKDAGANKMAENPHQFREMKSAKKVLLIIPSVSSERREYIPIGFLDDNTVISNLAFAIYDPPPHIFAIISSRIHMTWVRAVAGRLKTDYRYSSALCYNTFPFPDITEAQKTTLEEHVFKVLDEREQHSEKTMAELYDPDKMPAGLRQAHHAMDIAIEQCYRKQAFKSDEERLEYLFKLYEQMIAAEKQK